MGSRYNQREIWKCDVPSLIEGQNLNWRRHANQLKTRLAVSHQGGDVVS